ncbi:hypothetical protein [Nocardia sp. alder85J]|uniref:hypothetical protein n=1 Tax=Nocardia sp. alder85J TaxID=2862949 RepID=UPI001CD259F4|nr:hypothetical protein [Nocardia sp. alder85J]MCX4097766.1 hypothetical protein [Nocardia sp. alder85J]
MSSAATLLARRRDGGVEFGREEFAVLLAPQRPDAVVASMLTTLAMSRHSDTEAAALTAVFAGIDARPMGVAAQALAAVHGPACGVTLLTEPGRTCTAGEPVLAAHAPTTAPVRPWPWPWPRR